MKAYVVVNKKQKHANAPPEGVQTWEQGKIDGCSVQEVFYPY